MEDYDMEANIKDKFNLMISIKEGSNIYMLGI